MVCHTVVEFFSHVIFSFTKSVAERSNFDETEHNLEFFGYDPLDDTGREWYCQPVDELIYQEFSDKHVSTYDYLPSSKIRARFSNACSTEETEPMEAERNDRPMAWKQLRPSVVGTVCKSLHIAFFISVLSAFSIGIVSILIYYVSFQTQLTCLVHPQKSIPNKLRWVRAISEAIFVSLYYVWFPINVLFYFRPFQIAGLKLRIF